MLLVRGSATTIRPLSATLTAPHAPRSYKITLLPGDGIGPEITDATVAALEAVGKAKGITFDFDTQLIGGSAIDATGGPWPAATLESCQKADSILLAAIGGPKWDSVAREIRPESGLLAMRKQLGLFANLRPAKSIPQLLDASSLKREVVEGVDIMVVRELTGDVYFGEPKGIDVDADGKRTGYNNMIYSDYEVSRIAKVRRSSSVVVVVVVGLCVSRVDGAPAHTPPPPPSLPPTPAAGGLRHCRQARQQGVLDRQGQRA